MAGRKQNNSLYSDLEFTLLKINKKKYVAICEICKKNLANTAASRLKAHRNVCRRKSASMARLSILNFNVPNTISNNRDDVLNRSRDSDSDDDPETESLGKEESQSEMLLAEYPFNKNDIQIKVENDTSDVDATSSATDFIYEVAPFSPRSISEVDPFSSRSECQNVETTSQILSPFETQKTAAHLKKSKDNNNKEITPNEINELHEEIGIFFYGCNIPLSVVDSDHFRNFIRKLNPVYGVKLPDSKALSTNILDSAYQKCIDKIHDFVSSDSVLLIDGWINTANNTKTMVSMIHNASGSQAFLNAWDLTSESETGYKLTEIINESIEISKKLYNTSVYVVVSDSAASMPKIGCNIDIWHSSCSSHTANLLAKDVLNEDCTKYVILILKEFKLADFEKYLVDNGGSRIVTPVDTRWCSYRDSYVCLINNLTIMRTLIIYNPNFKKIKQNVKSIIFDDDFVDVVKENIELFDPICTLINRTQSKDCTAAEATKLWMNLKFPAKYAHFNPVLEHRKNMALNIYAISAFYLHPSYNKNVESEFTALQKENVHDFLLENLSAEGIEDLYHFQQKTSVFKILCDKNIMNPIIFWNMSKIKHSNLSNLAIKLLQIPASSAQIGRIFSNWSYVHSSVRNRLSFERSKKLLHVYYSLKMLDSNKSDEY